MNSPGREGIESAGAVYTVARLQNTRAKALSRRIAAGRTGLFVLLTILAGRLIIAP